MIGVSELRKGAVFEEDGQLWRVLDYDHYKPGRGNAIIRTKLRNLRTGSTVSRTFLSGASVQEVRLEHKTVQYMYNDGEYYYFMDTETFEQPALPADTLRDVIPYLKEGITIDLELHESDPIGIELPITVDLQVVDAAAGLCRRHGHSSHQRGHSGDGDEDASASLYQAGRCAAHRHPHRQLCDARLAERYIPHASVPMPQWGMGVLCFGRTPQRIRVQGPCCRGYVDLKIGPGRRSDPTQPIFILGDEHNL